MLLAHVGEQVVDELVDQPARGVDASDELRDHLQPGVDVDGANALHQSVVDVSEVTVVEPQCQQPGGGERTGENEQVLCRV